MKTFTAVLVGAVLGGVVTAGIMCHLLERQKALARRQATEIARLRAAAPPPKPTRGRTGQASVSESVAEQQLHAERRSLFERELRLKARVKEAAGERRLVVYFPDVAGLKTAIESTESDERLFALLTLLAMSDEAFGKTNYGRQVESLLASADADERLLALRVFTRGGMPVSQDEKVLRSLLADPSISVRQELVGSVSKFFGKDLTAAGGEMVLNLLQSPEPRDSGWVESLAEGTLSPALEERLIRLAQGNGGSDSMARAILNTCLGTQMNKSDACIEFLLARLADPDRRFSGRDMRAFWFGPIPKRFDRRIADAAVRVFEGPSGDEARFSAVTLFQRFGEADHVEAMGRWTQRTDLNPKVREQLESTMQQAADRLRREAAASQ